MSVAPLLLVLALAAGQAAAQTPVFSSRVDAVRVDVLVRERGEILRGLEAGDFEIFDNGVRQQVDLVSFERLPLSVVLAFDMSASVAGERLEHLRAAGRALLTQLAAGDQAALLTFSQRVQIDAPPTTDHGRVAKLLDRPAGSGRTALVDASQAGIVLGESAGHRSLLILFSDGVDTASWLRPGIVLDTARRADVVVYGATTAAARDAAYVEDLTSATGGARIHVESTGDLSAAFLRILDEFRQRYLLSYTPRGVARDGWHRLDIRVKGRRATVRARSGYRAGS